jgi:alpha-glucosidase
VGSVGPRHDGAWWRSAVIYQVYIRSFADQDGDGIGDLGGIRSRLPYLRDLGVDAIWITPFYPSPMVDGGYDVADYRDIDPLFGTLDDAQALIDDAHDHGIRVIIDIVPNHTSDQHPWFQAALDAPRGSPERARYIFRPGRGRDGDQPPNDWISVFGGSAWERIGDGDWYLHLFAVEQPDLDWTNREVTEEFESILRFWLDRGVDGFRIDVAHGLAKDPALPDLGDRLERTGRDRAKRWEHPHWDRDEVHEVYRGWRRVIDSYPGDRMTVAESWVATPERLVRYLGPDELHTAFNFDLLEAPWDAAAMRKAIDAYDVAHHAAGAPSTWVLSNHDVIRHRSRYGDGEQGLRRARAASLMMLALPGSAYLYQGEELGLPEVRDIPDELRQDPAFARTGGKNGFRDGSRVPIPWSRTGPSLGFGPAAGWLPQPDDWDALSVDAESGDPTSTLELYRAALAIRRREPALGDGSLRWHDAGRRALLFERPGPRSILVAVNFGKHDLRVPDAGDLLVASSPLAHPHTLPPDTAAWYRVDGRNVG